MNQLEKYNEQDVLLTRELYEQLKPEPIKLNWFQRLLLNVRCYVLTEWVLFKWIIIAKIQRWKER